MESEKHNSLVRELASIFGRNGLVVRAIDGVTVKRPQIVKNSGIGDRQDKIPDIEAYDERHKRIIRGEAKTGDGDINSEHSITQFMLLASRNLNGVSSWLYIIVPSRERYLLERTVSEHIPKEFQKNIGIVESSNF